MKNIFIISLFLLTMSSSSVLAQVNLNNKDPFPLLGIDRTLYDEDGISLKQLNLNKDIPPLDKNSTSTPNLDPVIYSTQSFTFDSKDVKQGELAACFDYYKFGSVNISLTTNRSSYESGGLRPIISGDIKNNNKYPLVDLDIKARLVKNISSSKDIYAENIILDEFDVAKDINIKAGGVHIISAYALNLPVNTPAGDYQILFYAVEKDRFNMSGLSFTNDVIASKVNFTITGSNPDHIYLDQSKVKVGKNPDSVKTFETEHLPDISIPINIPINNPSNVDKKMSITYDLYSWDNLRQENKIDTKVEVVNVPAKSSIDLIYILDKGVQPVYYLTITAEPEIQTRDKSVFKEKTISNIRFVIYGLSKPRINFTGVDTFPLNKNTEATLFTCFNNTNNNVDLNNVKIQTILYDHNNSEISRIEYDGKTPPEIIGLIKKFTPKKDIFNFTVITKIFDDKGGEIDSIEKKYSCFDIDPTICPKKQNTNMVAIIASFILILIILIILIYKKTKNKYIENK